MKSSTHLLKLLFVLAGIFPLISLAQDQRPGIKIVSGSKVIYSDPEGLENIMDEIYLRNYEDFSNKALSEFKIQVKNAVGQATRSENYNLDTSPYLEVGEGKDKVLLKYNLIFNQVQYRVTTPDIAFGIGAGRSNDPSFDLRWDMSFVYELSSNGNLEQLKVNFKHIELRNQIFNEDRIMKIVIIDAINGALLTVDDMYDWMFFGFQNYLFKITAAMALSLKDGLQQYLDLNVRSNAALLEENNIDGTNDLNLKFEMNSNSVVFEHPYSPAGYTARVSKESIEANEQLSIPVSSSIPASTDATKIKQKPLSVSKKATISKIKVDN